MRTFLSKVLVATAAVFALATAHASVIHFSTTLTGPNESPPNASTATGLAMVDVDTVLNTLHVHASFSGLTSGTMASHIHCCTALAGTGTAIVATTTPTFPGFPLGVTSGTFDNTFDLTAASSYNPAFVTANGGSVAAAEAALIAGMMAGDSYFNIHTVNFPTGEIRGFLAVVPTAVPEPWTAALLAAGLVGAALARRRRR